MNKKIVIAGAFGFVGKVIVDYLLKYTPHTIVALSRQPRESKNPRLVCLSVDLYSLKQSEKALEGADHAVYLVHSMAPSARLSQGEFEDFDFLLADNFARAAQTNGVKQVLYVGGIIPRKERLSKHLASRLEVEETLRTYSTPVTTLRCALIVGNEGSSFNIIVRLVEKLPVMILPRWMNTITQPVAVRDVAQVVSCCIDKPSQQHRIFDVGGPERITYKDIVKLTADKMKRTPKLIDVPNVPKVISRLWVRLVSGVSKELVYPLIDGVSTKMVLDPKNRLPNEWALQRTPMALAVMKAFTEHPQFEQPQLLPAFRSLSEVRSIQRIAIPRNLSADIIGRKYFEWLPFYLRPFFRVDGKDGVFVYRSFLLLNKPLIKLRHIPVRSSENRCLFKIEKGLLVSDKNRGHFEFRLAPDRGFGVIALNHFRPALPWPIYRFTQAKVHEWVMSSFVKFLRRTL